MNKIEFTTMNVDVIVDAGGATRRNFYSPMIILALIAICFSFSLSAQTNYYDCIDYYRDENYAQAIKCFSDYLKRNPKDVDALNMRAKCYGNVHDYSLAFADINEAMKCYNKKALSSKDGLYAQRGKFYADIENYNEALKDYATAYKINPKNTDVLFERANLFYNMENYAASDADWKQVLKIEKDNINAQIGLARNMIGRKQTDDAIKELNRLENIDPRNPYIFRYRSDAYADKGNYQKAIDDLIYWCYLDDVDKIKSSILLKYADHEFTYALAKVSEMILKDKDDCIQWLILRTTLYKENEMYREAVEDYNNIEALLPSPEIFIFYNRGICYTETGEYDRAIADFDEGLKLKEDKYLYIGRGRANRLKGEFQAAKADYTKVIELDPMNSYAYYVRGMTKQFEKDYTGALKDYTTAIDLDREYAYTYLKRGRLYRSQLNQPLLAEKDFQTVISLDNEIRKKGNCRQYALFFLDRIDDAMAYQNAILEKYPTSDNYYDAACLNSLTNRPVDAIQYLRLAFEKGFRYFTHIESDSDLENIRHTREFIDLVDEWKRKTAELSSATSQVTVSESGQTQKYVVKTKELKSGVYEMPCVVNDLPLKFIFDTGASDITLSSIEAAFMLKNDYLTEYDFRDRRNYLTASGDIVEGTKVRLRQVKVGDLELNNIEASVVHKQNAPLLFGQSALGRFVKITIDNKNNEIIFEH